jgi:peptide deformylase
MPGVKIVFTLLLSRLNASEDSPCCPFEITMAVRNLLRLGNPLLFQPCEPVLRSEFDVLHSVIDDLHDTLVAFREHYGPARAVAAPQIGVLKRLIYMNIDGSTVFINPVISDRSEEMFEIWDDCMSFPELLVKVRRHRTCTITYRDLEWNERTVRLTDLSELLQHECDHLDGILATMRAVDDRSIILRSERRFADGATANSE